MHVASLSSSLRSGLVRLSANSAGRTLRQPRTGVRTFAAMTASPAFDVYIKGAPKSGNQDTEGTTLDCPFSQRVMLTLGEKKVAFRKNFLDEDNLPEWLADYHPDGKKIPVAKDLEADKWIGDSDAIVKYIEEKYPEPKLGTPESTSDAGEDIMPKMVEYLKADKGTDEETKAKGELQGALKQFDEALTKKEGPYLSGNSPCAQCLSTAPKVYHLSIATKEIKGWDALAEYPHIVTFLDAMKGRDSWGPSAPVDDKAVVNGWQHKLEKLKSS